MIFIFFLKIFLQPITQVCNSDWLKKKKFDVRYILSAVHIVLLLGRLIVCLDFHLNCKIHAFNI